MSFSIVIETENLAMAGVDDLRRCLQTLAEQTVSVTSANEVLILVGGHLADHAAERVQQEFPWVTLYRYNGDLTYLAAKRVGAQRATGDIVVYADSDCAYDKTWLAETLAIYDRHPDAAVACSDTRVFSEKAYGLAMQMAWVFPTLRQGGPSYLASSFVLNNFAIRREVMLNAIFDDLPMYRGAIGFWHRRMIASGHRIYRVPRVMARHLPPQGGREWFLRTLVYGADQVARVDYQADAKGFAIYRPSLGRRILAALRVVGSRVKRLARSSMILASEGRAGRTSLFAAMPVAIASTAMIIGGAIYAVFAPQGAYRQITEFEAEEAV